MKLLLIILVLGALALGAAYYFGGVATMDPAQQATDFQAAVTPGMGWEEVVARHKPAEMVALWADGIYTRRQAPRRFNADELKAQLANGDLPEGFLLLFNFSAEHTYEAAFDPAGKFKSMDKLISAKDLYEGKLIY